MNDLISRSELINRLEETKMPKSYASHEVNQALELMGSMVKECVESMPSTGGWISSEERMPKVGEWVLIFVSNTEEMAVASLDYDKLGFSNDDNWYNFKNIRFWQPLPELPKGSKGRIGRLGGDKNV